MNDRGLSLSPTDMLKGYLLANITDETNQTASALTWKHILQKLTELDSEAPTPVTTPSHTRTNVNNT